MVGSESRVLAFRSIRIFCLLAKTMRASRADTSRVVKNGSVVSILIVETKRGGDCEKTGGVSSEIR